MGWALLFVLLFKAGDAALMVMAPTYWLDRGLTLSEIGLISTTLGILLSIVGALVGGVLVARRGLFTALVVGGIAQAVSNGGYLLVAAFEVGRWGLYPTALVESFCQGLGTAAFLSFLMLLCHREHAATQFALLTALYGFARDLVGALSGFGAEHLGYTAFFAGSCLVALPGLALLPVVGGIIGALGDREA
jgi:PAT family beta-lactamase induction signal transducer AmpG